MYRLMTATLLAFGAPDGATATDFLSNARHRQIADVALELDSLSHLSPPAFDLACASVLELWRNTKSTALKIRCLDLLCGEANQSRSVQVIAYLNECLDGLQSRKNVQNQALLGAFVTSDLSAWGDGIRNCPEAITLLVRIAGNHDVDPGIADMAAQSIYDLSSDLNAKPQAMLTLIQQRSRRAADLIVPIADAATISALRTILGQGEVNLQAARALAEIGDLDTLPILNQRKEELEAQTGQPFHDQLQFVNAAIHAIEVSQSDETLLAFIRSPAEDGDKFPFLKSWAISKAKQRGVDAAELRDAAMVWVNNGPPAIVRAGRKARALELGVIVAGDLPEVPEIDTSRFGHAYTPTRRTGPVSIPACKARGTPWKPNDANYVALGEWMATVPWESLSTDDAAKKLKAKMCELDLLHPENCMY